MEKNFLDSDVDYWKISKTIKDLYLSDGSVSALLDFERVLDEIDIYAFQNWDLAFLWLADSMPDPRGAKRLLPFDCTVKYKKSVMKIPIKVMSSDDFREGTKKPKIIEKDIWLVEITMPKDLITDIQTGSTELEGQDIDLEDLNLAYEQDLNTAGTEQEA